MSFLKDAWKEKTSSSTPSLVKLKNSISIQSYFGGFWRSYSPIRGGIMNKWLMNINIISGWTSHGCTPLEYRQYALHKAYTQYRYRQSMPLLTLLTKWLYEWLAYLEQHVRLSDNQPNSLLLWVRSTHSWYFQQTESDSQFDIVDGLAQIYASTYQIEHVPCSIHCNTNRAP